MPEDVPYYSLYHGMRSKKSPEQIKKEGFCAYGTVVDERKNIIDSLKFFGKEKLLTSEGRKGDRIRDAIKDIKNPDRRVVWATTDKNASCEWWAHANPEHISLVLHQIDIEPDDIDKYLKDKYGNNCYNIKLKIASRVQNTNFNTGINCIPPNLINSIEECKQCKFTGKEHV